jgi:hypothetical protein
MLVGVRPQDARDVRSRLRTVGQRQEREQALRDEREVDDPSLIGYLEPLQQIDAPARGRPFEDDEIISNVNIHRGSPRAAR